MDFKTARNCNCEQEVEKKIHVNERTGKNAQENKSTLGDSRESRQNHRTGKEKGEKSIFNLNLTKSLLR